MQSIIVSYFMVDYSIHIYFPNCYKITAMNLHRFCAKIHRTILRVNKAFVSTLFVSFSLAFSTVNINKTKFIIFPLFDYPPTNNYSKLVHSLCGLTSPLLMGNNFLCSVFSACHLLSPPTTTIINQLWNTKEILKNMTCWCFLRTWVVKSWGKCFQHFLCYNTLEWNIFIMRHRFLNKFGASAEAVQEAEIYAS